MAQARVSERSDWEFGVMRMRARIRPPASCKEAGEHAAVEKAAVSSLAPPFVGVFCYYKNYETKMVNLLKDITNLERVFKMSKYVDGFVLVVPKGKEAEYQKMAEMGRDSWMKHGALQYFECKGDDLKQQEMGDEKTRAYSEMAGASENENVWFSFIVFNSKQHRDEVNKKVMEEMSEKAKEQPDFSMPIDMKRMAYGGFEAAVEG